MFNHFYNFLLKNFYALDTFFLSAVTFFYKNAYFNINKIVNAYISKLIFFSFAFPVIKLINTYEITPKKIPSEML